MAGEISDRGASKALILAVVSISLVQSRTAHARRLNNFVKFTE